MVVEVSVEQIPMLLQDHSWKSRRTGCEAVKDLATRDPEVATLHGAAVCRLLEDDELFVRFAACECLGVFGQAMAPHLKPVAKCLSDRDVLVRMAACKVLIENAASLEKGSLCELAAAVASYLGGTSAEARKGACVVLKGIGKVLDQEGRQGLAESVVKLLQSASSDVRQCACFVLSSLGAAVAPHLQALAECLGDECWEVRIAACSALSKQGASFDEAGQRELLSTVAHHLDHRFVANRFGACQVLGHLGKSAAAHLHLLPARLGDCDWRVRVAACEALGRHGQAAAPFLGALRPLREDPKCEVRREVDKATLKITSSPAPVSEQPESPRLEGAVKQWEDGKSLRQEVARKAAALENMAKTFEEEFLWRESAENARMNELESLLTLLGPASMTSAVEAETVVRTETMDKAVSGGVSEAPMEPASKSAAPPSQRETEEVLRLRGSEAKMTPPDFKPPILPIEETMGKALCHSVGEAEAKPTHAEPIAQEFSVVPLKTEPELKEVAVNTCGIPLEGSRQGGAASSTTLAADSTEMIQATAELRGLLEEAEAAMRAAEERAAAEASAAAEATARVQTLEEGHRSTLEELKKKDDVAARELEKANELEKKIRQAEEAQATLKSEVAHLQKESTNLRGENSKLQNDLDAARKKCCSIM